MAKLDTCYAIIDAASEPDIFTMLEELDPPASCLYSEPIQPEIAELAPYLVEATPEVRKWLSQRDTPWGIYVYTQATMRELRQHLRKYLMVMIPGQDKPVFWRYYDPRNVWDVLSTFDNWRLHTFLGPIKKLETQLWGEHEESDFELERRRYPESVKQSGKLMKFTASQYADIEGVFERQFIRRISYFFLNARVSIIDEDESFCLDEWIVKAFERPPLNSVKLDQYYSDQSQVISWEMAYALVSFCQANGIHDKHSYMLLCYTLITYRIYRFEDVPEDWLNAMSSSEGVPHFRVEQFVQHQLGFLPDFLFKEK
ncbi:hypothetical protein AHYW_000246 [Providencia manganoxydans]|uniref:DUF4123 domain-containing protein n=1 Tax=Providencia manganoxydans TaxID=2923283 RepID=UPI003B9D2E07